MGQVGGAWVCQRRGPGGTCGADVVAPPRSPPSRSSPSAALPLVPLCGPAAPSVVGPWRAGREPEAERFCDFLCLSGTQMEPGGGCHEDALLPPQPCGAAVAVQQLARQRWLEACQAVRVFEQQVRGPADVRWLGPPPSQAPQAKS